jgi:hypothetical protein
MKQAEIFNFWEHKYRKIGYCRPLAKIFANTMAKQCAWINERLPHRLHSYLRYEADIAEKGERIKLEPHS